MTTSPRWLVGRNKQVTCVIGVISSVNELEEIVSNWLKETPCSVDGT
jgi:hypothetical protein